MKATTMPTPATPAPATQVVLPTSFSDLIGKEIKLFAPCLAASKLTHVKLLGIEGSAGIWLEVLTEEQTRTLFLPWGAISYLGVY